MSNQLKLGIFAAVGFLAIVVSIISTGSFTLRKTYHIYVKFDSISGLTRKAKVKIAGIDIGVLRSISLDDSKAELKLSIRKDAVLYKNASARIVSMGIIGTKYIEIVPGDSSFPKLEEGDYISSEQKPSIESTLTDITDRINKVLYSEKEGNIKDIVENLAVALYSLKEVLNNLSAQNNQIVSSINNFNKFSIDIVDISGQNKQDLKDTMSSVKDISAKVDVLITRIYDGDGPISTLINDEQMSKDLKETIASAKETVESLNNTIGKVGRLQLSWDYTGKYDIKDEKYVNDIGLKLASGNGRFYYLGVANGVDSRLTNGNENENINTLNALLGFRSEKAEIYGGAMKNKLGVGLGYSFFQPIYTNYTMLKVYLDAYNFRRDKYGPEIDAGIRFGITKWLYAGIAIEDISNKTSVMPYIKIEIKR
ncbi:MAG: MlaD family protein [Endomicrobium sp.]|jgi:phospholipid/cholesterol/gamma-HCH transport system substrate-binding protein|nr:MlaD family protein [Endomicrobium sp.]